MKQITHYAEQAVHAAATPREASLTVQKLFVVLHGAYGNLFLSKFATGDLNGEGKDKGVRAAMLVWSSALSGFPDDVIELACRRLQVQHPDFAPNLPQFVRECEALMPRKTHAEENGLVALPAPVLKRVDVKLDPVGDGKDWARVALARYEAGDETLTRFTLRSAMEALRCDKGLAKRGAA